MKLELTANCILANQSEFGYNGIRLPKADIINSPAHYALNMLEFVRIKNGNYIYRQLQATRTHRLVLVGGTRCPLY